VLGLDQQRAIDLEPGVHVPRGIRWLVLLYAPALSLLLAVAVAAAVLGIAPSRFTLDPAALTGAHPFLGVASNAGILLWAAAAAISLFTAALLADSARNGEARKFLRGAGLLTCWLMLDDLFLFHEWLFPSVLGVPQALVLAGYVAVVALFLLRFAASGLDANPLRGVPSGRNDSPNGLSPSAPPAASAVNSAPLFSGKDEDLPAGVREPAGSRP
jgi:hypothetical protein